MRDPHTVPQRAAAGTLKQQLTGGNRPPCPAGGRSSPTIATKDFRLTPLGIYIDHMPRRMEVQDVSTLDTRKICASLPRRFYKSKAWQQCRAGYIAYRRGLDGGMCEICQEVPGYIVHHKQHITPHNANNPDITLSWDNLQYVCKHCHDVEHGYCEQSKPSRVTFDTEGNPIPP